jgi:class 3 adenylate cyclase
LAEVEAVAGRTTVRPARHHAAVRTDLPQGTVTFLFTDVEASTKLLHDLGEDNYAEALAEHRRVLRLAFQRHGGAEVDTQGDAFFVAFPTARGALEAANEAMQELAGGPIRVRMGVHTGTPRLTREGYVGADVNRAARIASCGHGGQVLVSASTASLAGADRLRDLGEHRLKDLSAPERIYQLGDEEFLPLTSLYRTNLPIPATLFLGRERELTEVIDLLARPDVRLLTLTGPGGTGKTRLALQAVAEAAELYPDAPFRRSSRRTGWSFSLLGRVPQTRVSSQAPRSRSSAPGWSSCRSRWSLPQPAFVSSRRSNCSSGCPVDSTCSRRAAGSTHVSRRSGRRSSGATIS